MADGGVLIVGYARTPFGRRAGALRAVPAHGLGALAVDELLRRTGVDPTEVQALYAGVAGEAGSTIPARATVLASALPDTTPSLTVERACCSGMTALGLGLHALLGGAEELVICGGLDSASSAPPERADRQEARAATSTGSPLDADQLQAWATQSLAHYRRAEAAGWFAAEHAAINGLAGDECPRTDAAVTTLAPLADGAAFLLLATPRKAGKLGLQPLARLAGYAQLAGELAADSYLPVRVIRQLMRRQGRAMYEIDLLEIHEGSAATAVESTLQLGSFNPDLVAALRERTNVRGGALAIGHAPGASGARMTMTLVNELARRGQGRGIAAISDGLGQADAVMVEVPAT